MSAIELAIKELTDNTTLTEQYYSELKLEQSTKQDLDCILENSFTDDCSSI